ncbi:adenylosuccinate lyase [Neorickettsia helminthoeca str. Oregon]|uniref:Adenylosuccinate lyase n=1 Tax=Neorickettsia helminthoeca str. Oregon TaxID=1286528 RepID=X5GVH8_9RICK|nr:adenylosuccinate lyase [Neorickettsia helminthoeca]AHX11037.1 adenylosuccinate lyase [Neorickettsia helminthoeca str. Oregon]
MIPRYTREVAASIWSDETKFSLWLEIELLVCKAHSKLGNIPSDSLEVILSKASFNLERIAAVEATVKHDVIAFLTSVAESVGPASRYIHMGMTSSDVIDTCFSLQLRKAGLLLLDDLDRVLGAIKEKALKYKDTTCVGRSHGIHAEPMTLGLKFARFYQEFKRNRARLLDAIKEISVCKISGAVGQFASIDPFIQEYIAKELDLVPEIPATQVIPRDRYAVFFGILAVIASSMENIATEIRHLQRTEVLECAEFFSPGQKGSSAMPHKKNPVLSENLTGLARIVRSTVIPFLENVPLWHERDISHSSVERVLAPTACITLDFALDRLSKVVSELLVFEDNITDNLNLLRGLIFSQKVLLALVESGKTREEAYEIVQENAMKTWNDKNSSFIEHLKKDARVDLDNIERLFCYEGYLKHVDYIFENVFGE